MPLKKFLIVFIPYLVVYIGYIINELTFGNNVDVKGWWPLALTLVALFHFLVAIIYCVIDKLSPSSYRYTSVYSLLFALALAISFMVNNVLYPIDWYAVNMGEIELTTIQTVFNSPLFSTITTGLFLLSHFIIRWSIRSKSSL